MAPATLVVAGFGERDGAVQRAPRAVIVAVEELLAPLEGVATVDAATARLWLVQQASASASRAVLLSPHALLRLQERHPALADALSAPPDGLTVTPVDLGGVRALEVRSR
jgi:hypothetical protein